MTARIIISLLLTSLIIVLIFIPNVYPQKAEARCPNGSHKSPSGDCERVVPHEGKLPRCSNVFTVVQMEIVKGYLIIMVTVTGLIIIKTKAVFPQKMTRVQAAMVFPHHLMPHPLSHCHHQV
jgi:hypothetical protein